MITSTTSVEEYDWLSDFPMMSEWIGDKVIKQLSAFRYSIKNKAFEATIGVEARRYRGRKAGEIRAKHSISDGRPRCGLTGLSFPW